MRTCTQCHKENPDDFKFCRYCGAALSAPLHSGKKTIWQRLPAWVWILIFIAAAVGGIGLIIGSFVAIATIEGVASIILIICGVIGFGVYPLRAPENVGTFFRAVGLSFFALMGASVDQTGNLIYNKPIEMCFCTNGTSMSRSEQVSNPLPGTTYIQQDFTCYNTAGEPVKQINLFVIMGLRFVEYILLGYLLLALRKVLWRFKNK